MCYIQNKAQFQCHRISSDNVKYQLLISALDADTMQEVADVLMHTPENDEYTHLEAQFISWFTDSADRRLYKALTEIQLGDKKPTQLMRQITTLARDRALEDVLRVLWLALLPPPVKRCRKILR